MKNNKKAEQVQGTETPNEVATTLKVVRDETNSTTNPTEPNSGEVKKETPTEAKPKKDVVSIFEKSKKMNQVIEGLHNLDEAYKELDSITLSNSPRLKDTLRISDGRGGDFETSNNFLIENAIVFLKGKVEGRVTELETELQLLEAA